MNNFPYKPDDFEQDDSYLETLGNVIRNFAKHNKTGAIIVVASTLFIMFVAAWRITVMISDVKNNQTYVNERIGFKITGPKGWYLSTAHDGRDVYYDKRKDPKDPTNVTIQLKVERGNPFGSTPQDYVSRGILPQLRYQYRIRGGKPQNVMETPYVVYRKGAPWATVDFFYKYPDVDEVFVRMAHDYVFIMIFKAAGYISRRERQEFYKTMDSLVIFGKTQDALFTPKGKDEFSDSESGALEVAP